MIKNHVTPGSWVIPCDGTEIRLSRMDAGGFAGGLAPVIGGLVVAIDAHKNGSSRAVVLASSRLGWCYRSELRVVMP
jgi:hypothetical protein